MSERILMEGIYYEDSFPDPKTDPDSLFFIEIDKDRCIGCDTCLDYCPTGAIWGDFAEPHEIRFRELCINCGQCLTHCPENAIYESQSWVRKVDEMLADKSKKVIAMPAPAVRYALLLVIGLLFGVELLAELIEILGPNRTPLLKIMRYIGNSSYREEVRRRWKNKEHK